MKKKILVILAAGMGSRFGGPKQLYPVGPNGEFIMDYSIYSAIKYGFTKIVFVTREELLDDLKNTIGKRIEGKVEVAYVLQDINIKLPRQGLVIINGPSGCGKTTILNILSSLLEFEGDVLFDGVSYQKMTRKAPNYTTSNKSRTAFTR